MKTRKKYNKPETKVARIYQEFPLMSGSVDMKLNNTVVDPNEQLSKPSGHFQFFMESLDSIEK